MSVVSDDMLKDTAVQVTADETEGTHYSVSE